jgi:hypothetical protein
MVVSAILMLFIITSPSSLFGGKAAVRYAGLRK